MVDRGKRGIKRFTAVDAEEAYHSGPSRPQPTATTTRRCWARPWGYPGEALGPMPEERVSVHLDRGYDSEATRKRLEDRGLGTR